MSGAPTPDRFWILIAASMALSVVGATFGAVARPATVVTAAVTGALWLAGLAALIAAVVVLRRWRRGR